MELTASGSHNAFRTGPLTVHQGEVLPIDSDGTLYGPRNPASYQAQGKPACGTLSAAEGGCVPLISVFGAHAGIEGLRSSSGSQGRLDGRGDQDILGTSTTWWALARQAQTEGRNQQDPRLIQVKNADDFTLHDMDLLNSPDFHVTYRGGTGFTVWGVRIKSPADVRNTDGIDPGRATDVTIRNSWIQDGDDGIAVNGGSPVRNVAIASNHFYGTPVPARLRHPLRERQRLPHPVLHRRHGAGPARGELAVRHPVRLQRLQRRTAAGADPEQRQPRRRRQYRRIREDRPPQQHDHPVRDRRHRDRVPGGGSLPTCGFPACPALQPDIVGRALDRPPDVAHAVQERLIRAVDRLDDLRDTCAFGSWLVAVAMRPPASRR
ncbi:glycosyl hydrolase family 28 protein [Streptomyces lasalocidi]